MKKNHLQKAKDLANYRRKEIAKKVLSQAGVEKEQKKQVSILLGGCVSILMDFHKAKTRGAPLQLHGKCLSNDMISITLSGYFDPALVTFRDNDFGDVTEATPVVRVTILKGNKTEECRFTDVSDFSQFIVDRISQIL